MYAITVAKSESKLTKSEANPNGLPGLMFRGLGVLPVLVIDKVEKPTEN